MNSKEPKKPVELLPPHSEAAERGLIGCILLNSAVVMPELRDNISPEMFYDIRNRNLWTASWSLFERQSSVDVITLPMELQTMEGEVPLDYIMEIQQSATHELNWPEFAKTIQGSYAMRLVLQTCSRYTELAAKSKGKWGEILDGFEKEALSIQKHLNSKTCFHDNTAARKRVLGDYQTAHEGGVREGVKTGFYDLNRVAGLLRPQEFIVLAGTPSSGKTSLALNIVTRNALDENIKCAFISLETSGTKLVHRLNCVISGASGERLLNGRPTEDDLFRLRCHHQAITKALENVMIYDRSGLTPKQCVSVMRQAYAAGARLFVVDYLQLLDAGKDAKSPYARVTSLSTAMKAAAKELDAPVICVASLNRASTKEGREPNMSDLRDSGQIEYDADKIILLHALDAKEEVRTVQAHVIKNKDGATGKVKLTFLPESMQFKDAAIEYNEPNTKHPYADK